MRPGCPEPRGAEGGERIGFPGLCGPWGGITVDSGESLEASSSGGKASDICSKVHAAAVCDAPVSQGTDG